MTNTYELEKEIEKSGLKITKIAEKMGLSYYGLLKKIQGKNEFKAIEIAKMCTILRIDSLERKDEIFFAKEVDKMPTI